MYYQVVSEILIYLILLCKFRKKSPTRQPISDGEIRYMKRDLLPLWIPPEANLCPLQEEGWGPGSSVWIQNGPVPDLR
jgi:hypothetical protein